MPPSSNAPPSVIPRTVASLGVAWLFLATATGPTVHAQASGPPTTFQVFPTTSKIVLIKPNSKQAESRATVFLREADDPPQQLHGTHLHIGFLARELPRQALLIAAREGLGLATRDATLGEAAGAEEGAVIADLVTCILEGEYARVSVRRGPERTPKPDFLCDPDLRLARGDLLDLPKLVEFAETLSRGTLVAALRKAGCQGNPAPRRASAKVPEGVAERLDRLNLVDQFAAIRQVHEEIRARGEGPELLAALVRGYAQLGILTECHWDATSQAYKARSLLYAQRLAAANPKSPLALWHRAFARAVVGLHAAALADLESADALATADKSSPARPGWAGLIEATCQYRDKALNLPLTERHAQLAAVLRFATLEHSNCKSILLEAAVDGLRGNPECFRLWDALCNYGGVSILHVATTQGPASLAASLPARLRETPGLPPGVASDRDEWDEPAATRQLAEAGAPAKDAGEPSWTALAHLIREARFLMTWRRLDFMRDKWSVPVEEELAEARPLFAEHPYRNYLESFAFDPQRDQKAIAELMKDVKPRDYNYNSQLMINGLSRWEPERAVKLRGQMESRLDAIPRDLGCSMSVPTPQGKSKEARLLLKLSPHSPVAMASLIREDWDFSEGRVEAWLKETGRHPQLLAALSIHHDSRKQFEDSARFLREYVQRSPDLWAYERLAAIHLERGEPEKWKETLDEFLTKPDPGLEHQMVRAEIAARLMGEKKWDEALPYALDAAQTWSALGMISAIKCYHGLKDWENAELWASRLTERYPDNFWDEWFFCCLTFGYGDLKAAQAAASAWTRQLEGRASAVDLEKMAYFFWATGEPKESLKSFQLLLDNKSRGDYRLPLAMVADQAEDVALRDRMFDELVKDKDAAPHFKELLALIRTWIAKGKGAELDQEALDAVIEKFSPGGQATMNFLVGRLLETREELEAATKYLGRSSRSGKGYFRMQNLATGILRARGAYLGDLDAK